MFMIKKKKYDSVIRKEVDEIIESQRKTIKNFKSNVETLKLLLKEES